MPSAQRPHLLFSYEFYLIGHMACAGVGLFLQAESLLKEMETSGLNAYPAAQHAGLRAIASADGHEVAFQHLKDMKVCAVI